MTRSPSLTTLEPCGALYISGRFADSPIWHRLDTRVLDQEVRIALVSTSLAGESFPGEIVLCQQMKIFLTSNPVRGFLRFRFAFSPLAQSQAVLITVRAPLCDMMEGEENTGSPCG